MPDDDENDFDLRFRANHSHSSNWPNRPNLTLNYVLQVTIEKPKKTKSKATVDFATEDYSWITSPSLTTTDANQLHLTTSQVQDKKTVTSNDQHIDSYSTLSPTSVSTSAVDSDAKITQSSTELLKESFSNAANRISTTDQSETSTDKSVEVINGSTENIRRGATTIDLSTESNYVTSEADFINSVESNRFDRRTSTEMPIPQATDSASTQSDLVSASSDLSWDRVSVSPSFTKADPNHMALIRVRPTPTITINHILLDKFNTKKHLFPFHAPSIPKPLPNAESTLFTIFRPMQPKGKRASQLAETDHSTDLIVKMIEQSQLQSKSIKPVNSVKRINQVKLAKTLQPNKSPKSQKEANKSDFVEKAEDLCNGKPKPCVLKMIQDAQTEKNPNKSVWDVLRPVSRQMFKGSKSSKILSNLLEHLTEEQGINNPFF
jgi:hypothetical protein